MAMKFTIEHMSAGKWMKGATVTAEEVKAAGFDLEYWLKVGAVKEVASPVERSAAQAKSNTTPATDTAADTKPATDTAPAAELATTK